MTPTKCACCGIREADGVFSAAFSAPELAGLQFSSDCLRALGSDELCGAIRDRGIRERRAEGGHIEIAVVPYATQPPASTIALRTFADAVYYFGASEAEQYRHMYERPLRDLVITGTISVNTFAGTPNAADVTPWAPTLPTVPEPTIDLRRFEDFAKYVTANPTAFEPATCRTCSAVATFEGHCVYCANRAGNSADFALDEAHVEMAMGVHHAARNQAARSRNLAALEREKAPDTKSSRELSKPHPWECDE